MAHINLHPWYSAVNKLIVLCRAYEHLLRYLGMCPRVCLCKSGHEKAFTRCYCTQEKNKITVDIFIMYLLHVTNIAQVKTASAYFIPVYCM